MNRGYRWQNQSCCLQAPSEQSMLSLLEKANKALNTPPTRIPIEECDSDSEAEHDDITIPACRDSQAPPLQPDARDKDGQDHIRGTDDHAHPSTLATGALCISSCDYPAKSCSSRRVYVWGRGCSLCTALWLVAWVVRRLRLLTLLPRWRRMVARKGGSLI
jgi:hypothetical protein